MPVAWIIAANGGRTALLRGRRGKWESRETMKRSFVDDGVIRVLRRFTRYTGRSEKKYQPMGN
jgi:hypothetical protein